MAESSWCVSLVTALPFSGFLADVEQPDRRIGAAEHVSAYTAPSRANCTSSAAEQSTLAPESSTTTGLRGGRERRWRWRGARCLRAAGGAPAETAIWAPVLPAETNASHWPSAWRRKPTCIETVRFAAERRVGFSDISMTSGASTTCRRLACGARRRTRRDRHFIELPFDERLRGPRGGSCAPGSSSASASRAHRHGRARGRSRPPSRPTRSRANVRLPGRRLAAHRRSTRIRRRRDAGASAPGSGGTSAGRSAAQSCACCGRASCAWRFFVSGRPWESVRRG